MNRSKAETVFNLCLALVVVLLSSATITMAQKSNYSTIDSLIKVAESLKEKDANMSKLLSEKALTLSQKANYNSGIALAYKNMATLSMFQSDIPTAIATYKKAICFFENENSIRGVADCYNNIALAFSMNSKFDSSLIYYQKNIEMEKWLDDKVGIAETMENIGILYYYRGNSMRAMRYFLQAATIFNKVKEFALLNRTLVSISSIISDMGYHQLSIRLHKIALFMAQYFQNIRVMSTCYNNIGFSYSNLGEYGKALEFLNYSLDVKEQLEDKEGTMISLGIIGSIYRAQQRFDLSNQMYTNIIKISEEVDDKRQTAIGLTYIGENLRLQGKFEKAINYYLHSLEILLPIHALNEIRDNYQFLTYASYQMGEKIKTQNYYSKYKTYSDSTISHN